MNNSLLANTTAAFGRESFEPAVEQEIEQEVEQNISEQADLADQAGVEVMSPKFKDDASLINSEKERQIACPEETALD